jgi:hypothetical protein
MICLLCQDSLEKKHLEEMRNFTNKLVHVQLLAEDQVSHLQYIQNVYILFVYRYSMIDN